MTAPSAQACMSRFTAALLSRDIDAALGLLTEDALFFYSNGKVLRKADFATAMTAAWKVVEDYVYSKKGLRWVINGEATAMAIYGFQWSGVAGAQPVSGRGRATRAFVNKRHGWLLAHEHLSAGDAPA